MKLFSKIKRGLWMFMAIYLPTVIAWTVLRFVLVHGLSVHYHSLVKLAVPVDYVIYFPYWTAVGLNHLSASFLGTHITHMFGDSVLQVMLGMWTMGFVFILIPTLFIGLMIKLFVASFEMFWPNNWKQSKRARRALRENQPTTML